MTAAQCAGALTLIIAAAAPIRAQTAADSAWGHEWKASTQSAPRVQGLKAMGREANGDSLYVCRARYQYWIYPGKYGPSDNYCHIGWNGRAVRVDTFEVLVKMRGGWGPKNRPGLSSYQAGNDSVRMLSICRARHAGGLHPGKLLEDTCNIAFGDEEVAATDFEVFYQTLNGWWLPKVSSAPVPAGAQPLGTLNGNAVYACRFPATRPYSTIPYGVMVGSYRPQTDHTTCYAAYFDRRTTGPTTQRDAFEVLQLPAGKWLPAELTSDLTHAVFVGQNDAYEVYLCRVNNNGTYIGMIVPVWSEGCLYNGPGGGRVAKSFEIFVPDF